MRRGVGLTGGIEECGKVRVSSGWKVGVRER